MKCSEKKNGILNLGVSYSQLHSTIAPTHMSIWVAITHSFRDLLLAHVARVEGGLGRKETEESVPEHTYHTTCSQCQQLLGGALNCLRQWDLPNWWPQDVTAQACRFLDRMNPTFYYHSLCPIPRLPLQGTEGEWRLGARFELSLRNTLCFTHSCVSWWLRHSKWFTTEVAIFTRAGPAEDDPLLQCI